MPKSPFLNWLAIQEHRKHHAIFLIGCMTIFAVAWLFWVVTFMGAPGSVPPGLAATFISGLYATCMIYGSLIRTTGRRKCSNPMPFMRQELGQRHLRDEVKCVEPEYGGEEWDQHFVHVYCKVCRTEIVSYRCRKCDQLREEKVELPGSSHKLVHRADLKNQ